jgi:hypothetical protein
MKSFSIAKRVNGRIVRKAGFMKNDIYTIYKGYRYIPFMAGKNVPSRLKEMGWTLTISK